MSKIQIYVDGSAGAEQKVPGAIIHKKRIRATGWGIVAHFNGQTTEVSKGRQTGKGNSYDGEHEFIAFIEGVKLARSHGFIYEDMRIFTDFHELAHGHVACLPGNYQFKLKTHIYNRFRSICKRYYDAKTYRETLQALRRAQVSLQAGHEIYVDTNRADYLAKQAMKSILNKKKTNLVPYHIWVRQGFNVWVGGRRYNWKIPFSSNK
jgi:ribonuclease HI